MVEGCRLVLLDYLCKAVRQAPSQCILQVTGIPNAGVATHMTAGNSEQWAISNPQSATFMWCLKLHPLYRRERSYRHYKNTNK